MSVDTRAARWAAIDPAAMWVPMQAWFPAPPARVLEVGAGSGRDAVWFAGLGYDVTCVEPDRGLWPAGAEWQMDRLPGLSGVSGTYHLITVSAVWHLVPSDQWAASFERLCQLAEVRTRLILSLRMPPVSSSEDVVASAKRAGLRPVEVCVNSAQRLEDHTHGPSLPRHSIL